MTEVGAAKSLVGAWPRSPDVRVQGAGRAEVFFHGVVRYGQHNNSKVYLKFSVHSLIGD